MEYKLEKLVQLLAQTQQSVKDDASILVEIQNKITKKNSDGEALPRDTHCSRLIAAGFLEACCDWAKRHPDHTIISEWMELLGFLNEMALMPRTGKAIRGRIETIKPFLNDLLRMPTFMGEKGHPFVTSIFCLLSKATLVSPQDREKPYMCRVCCVRLREERIKQCGLCKRAIYCSKYCQLKDWKEGSHKQACYPEMKFSKKHAVYEQNLHDVGTKMLAQNSHRFCVMTSLMGLSALESVWIVDLTHKAQIMLEVMRFEDFIACFPAETQEKFTAMQKCIRDINEVFCIVSDTLDGSDYSSVRSVPPCESCNCESLIIQRDGEREYPVDFAEVRRHPEKCELLIQKLSHPWIYNVT